MKYGILTYHNIPNFGAVLQAFALCETVKQLGYECEIIDYECDNIKKRELEFHESTIFLKTVLHRLFIWPHKVKKINACQSFAIKDYSRHQYNKRSIIEANNQYDGFITGSDMIWNLFINGEDYSFFLDFTEDTKKRIAYGASIGDDWNESDKKVLKKYLRKYDSLSAREYDTCHMINNSFELDCKYVADPTMLMPPEYWEKILVSIKDKKYVLVYFPSEVLLKNAKKYCTEHKKQLIIIQMMLPFKRNNSLILYSPNEWLSYIKNADAVFTNSYHGLLFSLYFKKKVWTDNRNNRVSTVLNRLGLEQCFIKNDKMLLNQIDYKKCNKKMEEMRCNSMKYLEDALKG